MPPLNFSTRNISSLRAALFALLPLAAAQPAPAESVTPTTIRSRQIELYYKLTGGPQAEVELWYTRDRGMSWQLYGKDEDRTSPIVFNAPGEGLYGFTLIAKAGGQASRLTPKPYEPPQRWVFVDATPPLAQWNSVEPADGFATNRTLQLRWTAHDDNFSARPIGLAYQTSVEQVWHSIDDAVANVGVYDWKLPEKIAGQITLKLVVRDEGGHAVERIFGPLSLDRFVQTPPTQQTATAARTNSDEAAPAQLTRLDPASSRAASTEPETTVAPRSPLLAARDDRGPGFLPDVPASQPAFQPRVDILKQRMAADLYRQATWHMTRGQYTVAAERLHECIEQDPDMLDARRDLAGIFYRQKDFDRAIEEYRGVLDRNPNYESALYGAALAYVAKRDYSQSRDMLSRLLTINDHNAEAWLDLGDVLFMMGDTVNARGHWRRATKLDPSAQEIVAKAQRRLELYGPSDEVTSAVNASGKTGR